MKVSVRDLTVDDIQNIADYWHANDPVYLESMGVDLSKLGSREEFENGLKQKIEENQKLPKSQLNAQIICVDDLPIGMHTLSPLTKGESGVFHAHIWDQCAGSRPFYRSDH